MLRIQPYAMAKLFSFSSESSKLAICVATYFRTAIRLPNDPKREKTSDTGSDYAALEPTAERGEAGSPRQIAERISLLPVCGLHI